MFSKLLSAVTIVLVIIAALPFAEAQQPRFIALVNQSAFIPGDTLVVYGRAIPDDAVLVRVYDPAGRAISLDSILTDSNGAFSKQVLTWPEPSRSLPLGRYSVQVSSSLLPSDVITITVSFVSEREVITQQPLLSTLAVKLDSPTQVATGNTFRVFIQVTLDGALVNVNNPSELLGSSHIHFGDTTINLADRLHRLHEGIYYADVTVEEEGTYIIHAIAFHRGFLAHDSKVITASATTIGTIQETVNRLSHQLDATEQALIHTNEMLEETRQSLGEDVRIARDAVDQLQQASGQINALILPILVLISVIIALQISLFARIRSSFK